MAIQDKLSREERIRLEAFAQINMAHPAIRIRGKLKITEELVKFIQTGEIKEGEASHG